MIQAPDAFFDSDLLARLSRLELAARRVVDGFLAGKNRSSRHGLSVEFVEHREYAPGDDLRHLDWKVLGRMDRYYIKRYEEETNITGVLFVDASASMTYGSGKVTKFETAATVASALGYMLNRQRDAVGLVLHDTDLRVHLQPQIRLASVANLVASLHGTTPDGKTAIADLLRQVARELPRRCIFIMLSDFFLPLEEVETAVQFLHFHGHEAILLQVLDPAERSFPFDNNTLFKGLEDNRQLVTEPRRLKERYLEILERSIAGVRKVARDCAFDYQLLDSPDGLGQALTALLARRSQRQRIVRRGRGS